jgi:hypothetical protein
MRKNHNLKGDYLMTERPDFSSASSGNCFDIILLNNSYQKAV